jgi:hypothetical protein
MSVSFYGDYNTSETVIIPFNTFSSDDPSASVTATNLANGDIKIHKDGSVAQRSSNAGVSVTIDFDSVTGNHIASIDLSDNTDSGFYADGERYQVRIEGVTIDGGTVNAWIGAFSIGCTLRPTIAGRTIDIQSTGEVDANITMIGNSAQSATDIKDFADTGYDSSSHKVQGVLLVDTTTTNTDMRGTDSAALASVCTETRLSELDSANIPTGLSTIDSVVDGIKAVTDNLPDSGVLSSIAQASLLSTVDSNIDLILADTNELQADLSNGGRLDLIIDELTSQGDTNDSKLDIINGLVDTLITRLTAARAGYLDKLNVTGTLAHSDAASTYKADVSILATSASLAIVSTAVDGIQTDLGAVASLI